MADPPTSRVNWYDVTHPWHAKSDYLTTVQTEELYMFQKQEGLRLEREQRRQAFEDSLVRQRRKFEAEERLIHADVIYPFMYKLWDDGIEGARRKTVPAYTFTMFRQLPKELQLRIWSMAARSEPAKLHKVLAQRYDDEASFYLHEHQGLGRPSAGSSRVVREHNGWPLGETPVVLRLCQDSRMVAQRIYTRMRFCGNRQHAMATESYFNTLYDSFYLAEYSWDDFKILIDILIKQNTTRPLQPKVQRDMERFFQIRYLIVDFHVFAGVPATVWAEFPKLVKLTIAVYPYELINDREAIPDRYLGFVKPQKGSKYGKRADWVLTAASTALGAVGDEHRTWKIPELEVLVRQTGDDIDDDVEEHWTEDLEEYEREVAIDMKLDLLSQQEQENVRDDEDEEEGQQDNQDASGEEEEDDDSFWYDQAEERMNKPVSEAEIKRLKHEHHPSQRVAFTGARTRSFRRWDNRDEETWVSDSETESGGTYPGRPFIYRYTAL